MGFIVSLKETDSALHHNSTAQTPDKIYAIRMERGSMNSVNDHGPMGIIINTSAGHLTASVPCSTSTENLPAKSADSPDQDTYIPPPPITDPARLLTDKNLSIKEPHFGYPHTPGRNFRNLQPGEVIRAVYDHSDARIRRVLNRTRLAIVSAFSDNNSTIEQINNFFLSEDCALTSLIGR